MPTMPANRNADPFPVILCVGEQAMMDIVIIGSREQLKVSMMNDRTISV